MHHIYNIETHNSNYELLADSLSVGSEGLKFYLNGETVAWFLFWENWRIIK